MSELHTPGPWEQSNGVIFGPTVIAIGTALQNQSPTVTLANARLIAAVQAVRKEIEAVH